MLPPCRPDHVNPPSSVSSALSLHNPATSVTGAVVHCNERRTVPQPEGDGFGPLVVEGDQAGFGLLQVLNRLDGFRGCDLDVRVAVQLLLKHALDPPAGKRVDHEDDQAHRGEKEFLFRDFSVARLVKAVDVLYLCHFRQLADKECL